MRCNYYLFIKAGRELGPQLRNALKNPRCLRWSLYENFYSSIDK